MIPGKRRYLLFLLCLFDSIFYLLKIAVPVPSIQSIWAMARVALVFLSVVYRPDIAYPPLHEHIYNMKTMAVLHLKS
jgi:hypothetical protein